MIFAGVLLSRSLRPRPRSEVATVSHHHEQVFCMVAFCERVHDFDVRQVLPSSMDFIPAPEHQFAVGFQHAPSLAASP